MKLFHDEEDERAEPTPGLPQLLPSGERIIWQGKPDPIAFVRHVFHPGWVAVVIAAFASWRIASITARGGGADAVVAIASTTVISALVGFAIFVAIGWLMARSAIYTITDKRIVLRYGVAIRKYVNLPFQTIETISMKKIGRTAGSIALTVAGERPVAYLHLWPHTRPMRFSNPQPMLRGLADVAEIANILCTTMKIFSPTTVSIDPRSVEAAAPSTPGQTADPVTA